ncbi:MAG TPA: peptidoglycan-binding domain-containing protein [Prosthecobacter sp.]
MPLVFEKQAAPVYQSRVAFFQLLLGFSGQQVDGKFGSGTETRVKQHQQQKGLPVTGIVDEATGRSLGLPYWDTQIVRQLQEPFRDPGLFPSAQHNFAFKAEVAGGHFSSRPERRIQGDPGTLRALRTNNPGALNISTWQRQMPGYVGRTEDDGSGNKTSIYISPEKGVGAWYHLVVVRYEQLFQLISGGTGSSINVKRLAKAYGFGRPGKADANLTPQERAAMNDYLSGWTKWSQRINGQPLPGEREIAIASSSELMLLANAMFSHEASMATPLTKEQVEEGIRQRQTENPQPLNIAESVTENLDAEREDEIRDSEQRMNTIDKILKSGGDGSDEAREQAGMDLEK